MFRVLLILIGLCFVAACATLNEDQCHRANWYEIGFSDGSNGRAATFLSRHSKACEKHGIRPQQSPWEEGRQQGLRIFCVPETAYRIGRRGGGFPAVCTPSETIAMRPAFDWGYSYHELTNLIEELDLIIDERLDILADLEDPEDPLFELYLNQNFRDSRRIWRLERQRRKYEFWPPR